MKRLTVPIYDRYLYIFTNRKEAYDFTKTKFEEPIELDRRTVAQCNILTYKSTGSKRYSLTLNEKRWYKEKDIAQEATLAHECIHLAIMLIEDIGVEVNAENDELITYLTEYLYIQIKKSL